MTRRRVYAALPNPASARASTPGEIDAAFATLRQRRVGALLVGFKYVFS
jgi:hypothetical protein